MLLFDFKNKYNLEAAEKKKKWAVLYSTLHMQLTQILKNC